MQKIFENIISASFAPIIALNIFGSIIGAIWLFVLGEWKLVIAAFIVSALFPFAYSIIMLVQLPLIGLLAYLAERKKKALTIIVGFLNMLIGHAVDLAWVAVVFLYAVDFSEGQNSIPYLLFGWEIATGPFQYMASKEPPDSIGSYVAVYLTQISYLILAIFFLLGILSLAIPLIILITIGTEVYLLRLGFQLQKLEERGANLNLEPQFSGDYGKRLDEDSKFCPVCGTKIKKGRIFCTQCGEKIK